MSDQNSIPKAIINFVKSGVDREATHVDFNVLSESVVTWCLSDEPQNREVPSLHVQRVNDVRQIIRLKKNVRDLHKENVRLLELVRKLEKEGE